MLSIYTSKGIKDWDLATINGGIESIALMEKAARVCANQINKDFPNIDSKILILCGTGNNGGDGYAIARLLHRIGYPIKIISILYSDRFSKDCLINRNRIINKADIDHRDLKSGLISESFIDCDLIIDAIFGSGFNRPLSPWLINLIEQINSLTAKVLSVDVPSGSFIDEHTESLSIEADICYSFQSIKYAMLFPEFARRAKEIKVLDIGLDSNYSNPAELHGHQLVAEDLNYLMNKRERFSHKGTYGHALLIGGLNGKAGAALLSCEAALRSGSGMVSVRIDKQAYLSILAQRAEIMQAEEPLFEDLEKYDAIAIGPGLGTTASAIECLDALLKNVKGPIILDADALNILAAHNMYHLLPPKSIITPHPKEFARLFGNSSDGIARHKKQIAMSFKYNIYIILKDAYSCITTPEGQSYFSLFGNSGMATAGSGDVLTGILLGLMAQGIEINSACIAALLIHGLSGDAAALKHGQHGMIASDIIKQIGPVIKKSVDE